MIIAELRWNIDDVTKILYYANSRIRIYTHVFIYLFIQYNIIGVCSFVGRNGVAIDFIMITSDLPFTFFFYVPTPSPLSLSFLFRSSAFTSRDFTRRALVASPIVMSDRAINFNFHSFASSRTAPGSYGRERGSFSRARALPLQI